ncbi:MAG TPA: hypothetical protein H9866_07280 [Candidatus Tidjanibacter gallistercoris]|nr:hypothetical protein [Candidatus Tidjanibacter gallistercoris]
MKEEYRKARKEFAEAASGLEKEARTNAREAYERIKECADERMQAIKEGLREQVREEKETGDASARSNIRAAREAARKARDRVNMEVITARADLEGDRADLRADVADVKRSIREAAKEERPVGTYDVSGEARHTEEAIASDTAASLDRICRTGRETTDR